MKAVVSLLSLVSSVLLSTAAADNWPAWRGADGTGISSERDLPTTWDSGRNIRWKVPLAEACNSTPVIWGDRVFLTQGLDNGQRRALIAVDRRSGKILWQRAVNCDVKETTHRQNPPCSSSPITDGNAVYAHFASGGVSAFTMDGQPLWHRDLGPLLHRWGNGGSPVLYGELLIVFHGPGEPSTMMAFNKRTGKTVWKTDEVGINSPIFGSWSTPVLVRAAGRQELIMPFPGERIGGVGWFKSLDPATGKTLWKCDGLGNEVYAMPVIANDVVVGISGHNGPTLAVRPGGQGDVTQSHLLWKTEKKTPQRIGSGVIHKDLLYIANATGILECLVARTGELVWKQRLGGNLWGSILVAGDNLYVTNLEGDTFVIRAGRTYKLVSKNSIGEPTYAALAASQGALFLRSHQSLFCISEKPITGGTGR